MPPQLKEMKDAVSRLLADEEAAGLARDYERAAEFKVQRLQLEQEYQQARDMWQQENMLDEQVDADDIAQVVAQWTGIPVNQMLETESEKLLRMEEFLHQRIIGQAPAVHRYFRCHSPFAQRLKRPQAPDWFLHFPRFERCG